MTPHKQGDNQQWQGGKPQPTPGDLARLPELDRKLIRKAEAKRARRAARKEKKA